MTHYCKINDYRVIEGNPEEASLVEEVLRTMSATISRNRGCAESDVRDEELIDMMEQILEEDMETMEGSEEEGLSGPQEQVLQGNRFQGRRFYVPARVHNDVNL